jgi:hypothetical protein
MNATVPRGGSLSALLVGIDGDLATACTLMQPYLVVLSDNRSTLTTTLSHAAEKA